VAPDLREPLLGAEYQRLADTGALAGERVELLRGRVVEMSPQSARHAEVAELITELLIRNLAGTARVRCQLPFPVGADSVPEPDIAVFPRAGFGGGHPGQALLVVEVADSSLRQDRAIKAAIYAEAGVPEYWLVDLLRDVVEVRSAPAAGRYARVAARTRRDTIQLVAFPHIQVPVSGFLLG
jgi:Uma2 family endonuclease